MLSKCRCDRIFRDLPFLRRHEAKCKVLKAHEIQVYTTLFIPGGTSELDATRQVDDESSCFMGRRQRRKEESVQPRADCGPFEFHSQSEEMCGDYGSTNHDFASDPDNVLMADLGLFKATEDQGVALNIESDPLQPPDLPLAELSS
ncbi:hypothetical protein CVT26_011231 [Gymnopilus dilepis]|uniref:Uncharacterized protein n=1 Tax=Gymnopilus dilepis TaxID=231916 RepID=A0A409X0M3_9AGAR|nr:hypothetical protein CVT26_011231 [Gymnopilus dilepis]